MPESVRDRCTKSHEQIFLLTKRGKGYYWGQEALAEPLAGSSGPRLSQDVDAQAGSERVPGKTNGAMKAVSSAHLSFKREGSKREQVIPGQNVGTHRPDRAESSAAVIDQFLQQAPRLSDLVGRVPGNTGHKHTAAYEQGDEFSRIKSGLLKYGEGRAQLVRALDLAQEHGLTREHLEALRAVGLSTGTARANLQSGAGVNDAETQRLADDARAALGSYAQEFLSGTTRNARTVWTISTIPFKEAHFAVMSPVLAERMVLAVTPPGGVVLDPFFGAGTTGTAALKHGREYIGCELNPENVALSRRRIRRAQPGLALVGA